MIDAVFKCAVVLCGGLLFAGLMLVVLCASVFL